MGSFDGIHIALQSLLSQQYAMHVVEHNVANANTPGYHRQEAVLRPTLAIARGWIPSSMPGDLGTGVAVDSIRRYTMDFIDSRYRYELAESKRWKMEGEFLNQVDVTLNETSNEGLSVKIDDFWESWRALGTDPDMPSVRADLLERSNDLARAFSGRATRLFNLRQDQNLAIIQRVDEINMIAEQLAKLNREVARAPGDKNNPNDLLDEQGRLLDRLAEISGAVTRIQNNGQAMVSIGGHALVVGTSQFRLEATPDPANSNLVKVVWSDGIAYQGLSGEIAGLMHARDTVIVEQMARMDTLAAGLITRINALHTSGLDLTGAAGLEFFQGTDAQSIRVNPAITNEMIAASSVVDFGPGNGVIAQEIANVQNELLFNGGTASANQYDGERVAELAIAVRRASTYASDHDQVYGALSRQRESIVGVNLDEEAANMVKYQKAYNAAARVMTAVDEMLDRIINNMGLVGR